MKTGLKQAISMYFDSWWIPSVICLVLLGVFTISGSQDWQPPDIVSNILFVCVVLAFLGVFSAAGWNFIRKRWAKGVVNLVLVPACGVIAFTAVGFLMFSSMSGPSEDGFADNLAIPENIEIAEPLDELDVVPGGARDAFQESLLTALSSHGDDDPTITADVAMLAKVHQDAPEILRRYLATNPSWRVFKEDGKFFATRRWMIGSEWRYDLHGYYTTHDIGIWAMDDILNFQSRFTIGFSGKPWAGISRGATRMKAGQTRPLKLSIGNQMHESRCIITADDLVVEVFEQSEAKERRLTKAALSHVEKELSPLAAHPTWETIRGILPAGSIRQGEASLELRNSLQPGIYDSTIWVNPGEPGMLYLKAFEVTQGTPLSVDRLKERSNEWIGWSDNPGEVFLSNTHFTIYEGDWGIPYAARFEVWFTPDSGGPDQNLMEKIFRIEGWQR